LSAAKSKSEANSKKDQELAKEKEEQKSQFDALTVKNAKLSAELEVAQSIKKDFQAIES
jgi:hypothetical protein